MDIRSLRKEHGLSQKKLSDILTVHLSQLSKWERCLENPTQDIYNRLAVIFNCDAQDLKKNQITYCKSVTPGEGYTTLRSNGEFNLDRQMNLQSNKINILDLFCGAGGLSLGFDNVKEYQVTCGIDFLPDRIRSFHNNHPNAIAIASDIREYPIEKLHEYASNPDVIIGGPPCQGFSSIRPYRTLTEGDNRNSLIEVFLIIVAKMQVKWFLFENVIGILTHNKGKTFQSLISGFEGVGYQVDWRVINAANYGVPQNRERVFIIGNSIGRIFEWPKPTHYVNHRSMASKQSKLISPEPLFDGYLPPAISIMQAIHDLPELSSGEESSVYRLDVELTDFERDMRGISSHITLHKSTNHSIKMLEIIRLSGQNRSKLPDGLTNSGFSSTYSRLDPDKPSTTITVNFVHPASNRCIHPYQNRALTPREGARLQSFPDEYEFYGTRSQIVKQIGNAVPPLLANILAHAIQQQF